MLEAGLEAFVVAASSAVGGAIPEYTLHGMLSD